MKRPSLQVYPADWLSNAKLRRCSEAARGAWFDIICFLHGCDEYGVVRWPLADLIRASGVSRRSAMELVEKEVLKGGDKGCEAFVFVPRHAGQDGEPVTLIEACKGPCWYSSRMVRDEHIRKVRGAGSRFSDTKQPPKKGPKRRDGERPKRPPKGGIGGRQGDGPSSSSSSSEEDTPLPPLEHRDLFREPLCTIEQALAYGPQCRMSPEAVQFWWWTRDAAGWCRGGVGNAPIRRWQSDMAASRDWAEEGAKKGGKAAGGSGNFKAEDIRI